jgi:hypothetical protein
MFILLLHPNLLHNAANTGPGCQSSMVIFGARLTPSAALQRSTTRSAIS